MQTMRSTLLVGPADWDPAIMPRAEFDARLAALWRDHPAAAGAVVYGDRSEHAALAYLTGFTPKLEAAVALLPRAGETELLVGGGVNMVGAARPLTYIERLAPLRDGGAAIATWASTRKQGGEILLIGGDAMPADLRGALDSVVASDITLRASDRKLQARMRIKSPCELAAIRKACGDLEATVAALRSAWSAGKGVTDCIVAAEHAAIERGGQDVRSLFSLDGGRTLRPFAIPVAARQPALQVYLAVRHAGYWADGCVRAADPGDPLQASIDSVLDAVLRRAKAGVSWRDLLAAADERRGTTPAHPQADGLAGSSIGLALDEAPALGRDGDAVLEDGAVYSLRTGLIDGSKAVIGSMLIHLTPRGADVMWRGTTA